MGFSFSDLYNNNVVKTVFPVAAIGTAAASKAFDSAKAQASGGTGNTSLIDSEPVKNQQAFAQNLQQGLATYQPGAAPQIGNNGQVSSAGAVNPVKGLAWGGDTAATTGYAYVDQNGNPATNFGVPGQPPVDSNGFPITPVSQNGQGNPVTQQSTGSGNANNYFSNYVAQANGQAPLVTNDPNNPGYVPPDQRQTLAQNIAASGGNINTYLSTATGAQSSPSIYGGPAAQSATAKVGSFAPAVAGTVDAGSGVHAQQIGNVPQVGTSTVNAPGAITSQNVTADRIAGQVGGITAQQIGNAPQVTYDKVGAPSKVNSTNISAQQIGGIGDVNATTAGTNALNVQGPGANAQAFALNLLGQGAVGQGPSAAQAQFTLNSDVATKRALAAAAGNQTANTGSALRQGIEGTVEGNQTAATQAAALRAQEQQAAQQLYSQQATNTGLQNIDVAKSNQANQEDIALANQKSQLAAAVQNQQTKLDTLKANQQAALDAGKSNQAAALQAEINNATNELEAAKSNQAASLTASTSNASNFIDVAKANQQATLAAATTSLQAKLDALKSDQAAALDAGKSNQAAALQAEINNATNELEAAKSNATNALAASTSNATNAIDVGKANQTADLAAQTTTANNALAASTTNANNATSVSTENMKALQAAALKDVDIANAVNQFNASAQTDMTKFGATQALDQAKSNLQAQLTSKGYDQQFIESLINSTNSALQGPVNAVMAQNTLNQQNNAANQAFLSTLIGTGATIAAA